MKELRRRFNAEKDAVIESALGKQESWAKKVGTNISGVMLDDIPALIDVLGLKLVDKSKKCVDAEVFNAYRTITAAAMNGTLHWEDE